MTHQSNPELLNTVLQLLNEEGTGGLAEGSHCAAQLDAELEIWRPRPLDYFPYVFIDARYEKVRQVGRLLDCAVLLALGIGLDGNLPQGLAIFAFPTAHQRRLRTSNPLGRVNMELKRRTRVAGLFPNEASLLCLVSALLAETSEEWETGKIYLKKTCAASPGFFIRANKPSLL